MSVGALLGRSLDEVLALSDVELQAWIQYVQVNPPNGAELILAHICTAIQQLVGRKDAEPVMVAPWLESPEAREQRER